GRPRPHLRIEPPTRRPLSAHRATHRRTDRGRLGRGSPAIDGGGFGAKQNRDTSRGLPGTGRAPAWQALATGGGRAHQDPHPATGAATIDLVSARAWYSLDRSEARRIASRNREEDSPAH